MHLFWIIKASLSSLKAPCQKMLSEKITKFFLFVLVSLVSFRVWYAQGPPSFNTTPAHTCFRACFSRQDPFTSSHHILSSAKCGNTVWLPFGTHCPNQFLFYFSKTVTTQWKITFRNHQFWVCAVLTTSWPFDLKYL